METLPQSLTGALSIARQKGVLRARDLDEVGVPRTALSALVERGLLQRIERGSYIIPGADWNEHQRLIEVSRRVPRGVICLLSALRFHEIGTQEPPVVWLCIESGLKSPKVAHQKLEIVRQSGRAWSEGVVEYQLPVGETSVGVKITEPAKTVADCFKFRNLVGLDVALEALHDSLRRKSVTHQELWHYATINRVANVMRPYLETVATL